ncbi:Dabb family protein [Rhizobium sp. G21]|nr:Dabb family protein [Rhizobium sp. G21]
MLWANGGQPASAEARVIRPIVCSSPSATNLTTDQLGGEADLVVYGEFEDEAQLAAYKAHPNYQRSIEIVRPLREMRIAADYRVEEAARGSLA